MERSKRKKELLKKIKRGKKEVIGERVKEVMGERVKEVIGERVKEKKNYSRWKRLKSLEKKMEAMKKIKRRRYEMKKK